MVVSISIGYAALTTTLNINGNTKIEKSSWDIHFENLVKSDGSVIATTEASIDLYKTLIEYTVMLAEPGDFYEFTVDIVNAGSIDAMISEVLKEGLSTDQEKYIEYTATYLDGADLQEKDPLYAGESENIIVRVKYKDDITAEELPTEDVTLTLKFHVTYVQYQHEELKYGCEVTSGDGTKIGDEITCRDESFYVISTTDDSIKMLAKYNLNVGDKAYPSATLGLQNENVKGYYSGGMEYGSVIFSEDNYWVDDNGNILSTYGTGYPMFVYNNNSNLYQYVEAYESYLKDEVRVASADAALLSRDEAIDLGCVPVQQNCASSEYPWLYSTSYWLSYANGTNFVWIIHTTSSFGDSRNDSDVAFGVRPVITISKDEL